jgi:N-ethylmaleimide reductase
VIDTDILVAKFDGGIILNHGYTRDLAVAALRDGRAHMIAFGRPFISNPDLVKRLQIGAPLAEASREVWYSGGAKGLIDFPAYDAAGA